MITNLAIDAGALGIRNIPSPESRGTSRRLADTVATYGVLHFLSQEDSEGFRRAAKAQAQALGYDFWSPVLKALDSLGRLPDPRDSNATSLQKRLLAGDFDYLKDLLDLVVVGDSTKVTGLNRDLERDLYETTGSAIHESGVELTLASTIDHTRTIERLMLRRTEPAIPKGMTADDAWAQYFKPFTRISSFVTVSDRYLFSSLVSYSGGRRSNAYLEWLFNSLVRDLPTKSAIKVIAMTGESLTRDKRGAKPYTEGEVISFLESALGHRTDLTISLYLTQKMEHDRYIRFGCKNAVAPTSGFDKFEFDSDGALKDSVRFTLYNEGPELSRIADIEQTVGRPIKNIVSPRLCSPAMAMNAVHNSTARKTDPLRSDR